MIVSIDHEAGVVRKEATSAIEAARLTNEALVLGVARHPGVVRLLDFDGGVIETRFVPSAGSLTQQQMATLATTLADLHAIGVVHGAIEPSHVLIPADGKPVLCGFSQGAVGATRAAMADDAAALAAMLRAQADGPLAAVLDKAIRKRWSAEQLAAACLANPGPAPRPARGQKATGPWRRRQPAALRPARSHAAARPRRLAAPVVAACIALTIAVGSGRGSPRYELGQPGDQVVYGRWHCKPMALPALLRRSTGTVWVWDHWPPPGSRSPGRMLARARRLAVQPGPPGCDRLIITPPVP